MDLATSSSQFLANYELCCAILLVAKLAMPRIAEVLEERQERTEDDLDKAETLKEAYQVRIEYEKALSAAEKRHRTRPPPRKMQAECRSRVDGTVKVTVMLEEAEKRIAASKTEKAR